MKKALLIGINDYQRISDLRGCVNDVTNIRSILKQFYGFTNSDIRVLVDARATREAILHRMDWLKKDLKPGDQIFFHFSGHGSQIRDRDGDELRDHKDEIICCYGMSWNGGYITDDEFDAFFKSLPKDVKCEVIFDACHSGTGNSVRPKRDRALDTETGVWMEVPVDVKGRFLEPPLDVELRSEGEDLKVKRFATGIIPKLFPKGTDPIQAPATDHAIWSGCGEAQTSADAYIKGNFAGAFSYYFCKTVRQYNGKVTRRDILQNMRASLSHHGYTQIPELTCDNVVADRMLLS